MVQIIMVLRWQLSQVEHSFTSCRPHPVFTLYSDGHRSWQPLHNHDYKVIYCTHNIPSYHQCQIGEKNYKKKLIFGQLQPRMSCSLPVHWINMDQSIQTKTLISLHLLQTLPSNGPHGEIFCGLAAPRDTALRCKRGPK